MSFSSKTKSELARNFSERKCCQIAELAAFVRMSGTLQLVGLKKFNVIISTENPSVARKVFKLFKLLFDINTEVMIRKNLKLNKNNYYLMGITHQMNSWDILKQLGILQDQNDNFDITYEIPEVLVKKRCCKRAYLRGAFMSGGSISDPEKTYHLEFVTNNQEHSEDLKDLINLFDLSAKIVERKGNLVVYLKEGDQIVDLLNIVGAHQALLELENIRIYKQMRNDVNRIVNCETANLSKTVNASMRQIENIKYIIARVGLNGIPENLRELAQKRLNYHDASLKELGQMLNPSIGKSGVNHRLRKLDELANKLKNM
ncbi:DNA-binding protein WhiA [Serpentinicella sp. ANB-PHB4]|uniref:DNA-binding protein WhiA n=1 Tax=Serpentinicella sp. ANB-PHB4 TaxID=3074076 RepID=UPI002865D805|nr:DNA-binding protein WhiA [Serpentinicella sp. ANB-PHB4]MDR5659378.1 DNA-binding protein WhiA [Serpentinicella sp. ANB-PHB4]